MKCINCYREIGIGSKFCNYCGALQTQSSAAYPTPPAPPSPLSPMSPPSPPTPTRVPNVEVTPVITHQQDVYAPIDDDASLSQQFIEDADTHTNFFSEPEPTPKPANDDYDYPAQPKPRKTGMSGWAKALLTMSILMLLGAIGGGVYYLFFYNKVDKLSPDIDHVKFSRKGGEKKVTITTDAEEFKVTKKPDWVNVVVGDKEIIIKCMPLEDYEDRDDIIKLEAGGKEAKITVKQSAKATYMRLSRDYIKTGYKGEEVIIEIDTDGDPSTIKYDIEDPLLCTVSEKTSTGFTLTVEENSNYSLRKGSVTIGSDNQEQTITIVQASKCNYCDGTGKNKCIFCDGTGRKDCFHCNDGLVSDGWNYEEGEPIYSRCDQCGGKGYIPCSKCNGRGYETCEYCDGTGNKFNN